MWHGDEKVCVPPIEKLRGLKRIEPRFLVDTRWSLVSVGVAFEVLALAIRLPGLSS